MTPLTSILRKGQRYLDEPVFSYPKQVSEIERSVARIFGRAIVVKPILLGYERVHLDWVCEND
jgi:hypothetical protein